MINLNGSMDRAKKQVAFLLLASTVGYFGSVSPATAEIANEFEPDYAEAVLEYNSQKYENALRLLTEVQKKAPKSSEVLELKAITYKSLKNEKGAAETYRDLIQLKTKEGKEKKEIAPYAFELGVIRYGEKSWKQAEQYLNYSAKNGFNVEVSNFYLGLIYSQNESWKLAEKSLKETLSGGVEELKPAAYYYLAQIYFKTSSAADGFGNLIEAKKSAQKFIDREDVLPESKKMAEQVKQAAEATLAPFDKSQFFANFSLLTGYDSNVLLEPTAVNVSSGSGKSSLKTLLSAGAGYATSPLRTFQYVPSIRFNLNKNYNSSSYSGEFADTTLSLYITKDALAPVSIGLKSEGGLIFQTQADPVTSAKSYHLFNSTMLFSPYLKWDQSKAWTFGGEFGYRITTFTGEETVSEANKRSGNTLVFKASAQNKRTSKYFNPTYAVHMDLVQTNGTEFDATVTGFQLINTMKLGKIDFNQVFIYDKTSYGSSSTNRSDTLKVLALQATKKIGPRWALVGSGDYTINSSTEDTSFSYTKYSFNFGVGYSF